MLTRVESDIVRELENVINLYMKIEKLIDEVKSLS